jgi:hypothetical protein
MENKIHEKIMMAAKKSSRGYILRIHSRAKKKLAKIEEKLINVE